MAGRIFINYRQDDTAPAAQRLKDELERQILNVSVYLDQAVNRGGDHYRDRIDREIAQCNVFVCLIGKNWLDITGEDGQPRLHATQDIVRSEIELAMLRSKQILPVLVEGAKMPSAASLPPTIWLLPEYHADHFREDKLEADIATIVASVKRRMSGQYQSRSWWDLSRDWLFRPLAVACAVIAGLVLGNLYPGGPVMDAASWFGVRPRLHVENEVLRVSVDRLTAERDAAINKYDAAQQSEKGMREAFVQDVRKYSAEETLGVLQEYQRQLEEARRGRSEAERRAAALAPHDSKAPASPAHANGRQTQSGGPLAVAEGVQQTSPAQPTRRRCSWTLNLWPQCW